LLDAIYTIGHSTRTFDEFVAILASFEIERLVDIRRFPGSRRHPHFSGESLARTLPAQGVAYEHAVALGGRRSTSINSLNTGLRNPSFRGYADYMQTPAFLDAVSDLLSDSRRTAIMCAEAVPWRCHRNLVSDDLVRRGVTVRHILSETEQRDHALHELGRIGEGFVYYPGPHEQGKLFR
jgi:uncharacterized protein (DUF488 family)